jgi:hypothetical protein
VKRHVQLGCGFTGERPTAIGFAGVAVPTAAALAHGEEALVKLGPHMADVTRPGGAPWTLRAEVEPAIEGR